MNKETGLCEAQGEIFKKEKMSYQCKILSDDYVK